VRLELVHDSLLVIQDVLLRRGDWAAGDVDIYVSFGAPRVPRALDAHLCPAADDGTPTLSADEPLAVERAARRPPRARLLLGTSSMAGAVLHLPAATFDRATKATGVARLRIRTLIDAPRPDARSGHEVLVRLGSHLGEPIALGEIEVSSDDRQDRIARVEAHLCGPDADLLPLAVRAEPPLPPTPRPGVEPVAPSLSVRHASDDLCVRYWTTSGR
jgi:hypothetical protein